MLPDLAAGLSAPTLSRWIRAGRDALVAAKDAIDALNVFPVPDGDTGTNMSLTSTAAVDALDEAIASDPSLDGDPIRLFRAVARGALLGARGNSGIILSELLRGFGIGFERAAGSAPGIVLAQALREAAQAAREAVAEPVEGTVLTVADAAGDAAAGAAEQSPADPAAVMRAAADAARHALAATTAQLPALRRAGVVDSGGQGLVVLYGVLEAILSGIALPVVHIDPPPRRNSPSAAPTSGAYEVMYLLDPGPGTAADLRTHLTEIGDSVVVVGDEQGWNVHVHCDDAGAAIEAGLVHGRPHRILVTWLGVEREHVRGVVVVTHGPGVADLVAAVGATPVPARPREAPSTAELLSAVHTARAEQVVILPSDGATRSVAETVARLARLEGIRVTVVPTRSIVQSLAALAVHDAALAYDDDVVAMTRAAHATKYAGVTTAVREALTSAGRCLPGDVIGVVDGDVVEIGSTTLDVSTAVLERLLRPGGELVTLITGADATAGDIDGVARWLRRTHAGVELTTHDGGQPLWPLIIGVE